MSAAKAIIFDLDGVLVDTVELHFQSWKFLADRYGIPFSREDMTAFRGRQRRDCLLDLFPNRSLTEAEIQALLDVKNRHYLAHLNRMAPHRLLKPYAMQVIETAHALGLNLGVASSSANAVRVLRRVNLHHLIDAVADGNTVSRSKPAPDIFLWVAGALGVKPAECVVFEDSEAGVAAACEGGMYVVGVGHEQPVRQAHLALPDLGAMPLNEILDHANKHNRVLPHLTSVLKEI